MQQPLAYILQTSLQHKVFSIAATLAQVAFPRHVKVRLHTTINQADSDT
jgi:hypothetical protein